MTSVPAGVDADRVGDWLACCWVAPEVWQLRPDYRVMLLAARDLQPGPSDMISERLLTAAEEVATARLSGRSPEDLPEVVTWREAYRSFGAKPNRARPSVEALLRRLEAGLPRVDRLTDVYNAVSVSHLLPIGGEDLAHYEGPLRLVRATSDETFETMASGQPVLEHPEPGEVAWRDDLGITCRRWNWRQCTRTRLSHDTASAVFVLDWLPAGGDHPSLEDAGDALADLLAELSPGAGVETRVLHNSRNS